jgi:hypothetical protein
MRWLLTLALVLCVGAPLQAQTWTNVDYDSTPADNGVENALTTCTIDTTNITGAATGDLVVLVAWARSTSSALSVGGSPNDGGVTWTSYAQSTHTVATSLSMLVAWSTVDSNGFSGNLVVTDSGTGVINTACGVAVFHPSTGTVAEDVALALDNNDAAASPVVVAAATTNTDNAIAIALWVSGDDNTWNTLTADWATPTNQGAQTRHNGTQDSSMAMAWKAITPVGSTGTVSYTQATVGPDATIHGMVVFKATGGGGGGGTPCVIGGGITRPGCPGEQQ